MTSLLAPLFNLLRRSDVRTEEDGLIRNSVDIICRIGPDLKIRYLSPAARQIVGRAPEDLIGSMARTLFEIEDENLIEASNGWLKDGTDHDAIALRCRILRPDRKQVWVDARIKRVSVGNAEAQHEFVLGMRDVTEQKQLEERLADETMQDGLTGLANRRAFDESVDREWQRTVRENSQMALILLDIDFLMRFNDCYGRQGGDDCLRAIAGAVSSCLRRSSDLVARYGGEEFAIILADTDAQSAARMAERIQSAIAELRIPHATNDNSPYVTVSLGVATAMGRIVGMKHMPEGLLRAANTALRRAKANGRNRSEASVLLIPPSH